jgi:D-threo-aldose 1-dehydrogenase
VSNIDTDHGEAHGLDLVTRTLGRSEVNVGRVALGAAALGGLFTAVDPDEAVSVVHRALELGLTHIDTAPQYGHGVSERRVGAALASVPRDSFTLSTKVGRLIVARDGADTGWFADAPPSDAVFDFTPSGIEQSLAESLERLGLDRVDVVLIHDPDDHLDEAIDGAYPTLARLRDTHVIGAIGVGVNSVGTALRFVRETEIDAVLIAGRWTLLDRSAGDELLPECGTAGVSVIVGGVFNSGILANPGPNATYDYLPAPSHLVARAEQFAAACKRHDVALSAAALQFPYRHPAVDSVLVGPRSVAELEASIAGLHVHIPDALWAELDA